MKRKAAKNEALTNNMTPTESMAHDQGQTQFDEQSEDRQANRNSHQGKQGERLVTKKHVKSKDMKNHKKPMNPDILEEEFGSELGDINSSKWIDTLTKPKKTMYVILNRKTKNK